MNIPPSDISEYLTAKSGYLCADGPVGASSLVGEEAGLDLPIPLMIARYTDLSVKNDQISFTIDLIRIFRFEKCENDVDLLARQVSLQVDDFDYVKEDIPDDFFGIALFHRSPGALIESSVQLFPDGNPFAEGRLKNMLK